MKTTRLLPILFVFFLFGVATVFAQNATDNVNNAPILTLPDPVTEIIGSNNGATKEPGEPDHAQNRGGQSVWYKIVPQTPMILKISISKTQLNNSFDTLLAVYKGFQPSALNLVAQNDNMNSQKLSRVDLKLEPGNVYCVAVDGFYDGVKTDHGNFAIRFERFAAPQNDDPDFQNLVFFPDNSESGFTTGTNVNATKNAG